MKKWTRFLALVLALIMALALSACGGGDSKAPAESSAPAEDAAEKADAEEAETEVDCIDLDCDEGTLKYVRFEKANAGLTKNDNDYVFVFEYTNKKSEPSQAQATFNIKFFQNGVELDNSSSYSSKGGDQYELVGAYFNEALKGGTVTFGDIASPKDDSPITVMVRCYANDTYQTMEVDLNDTASAAADNPAADMSEDEVEEALQGTWTLQDSNFFTFEDGKISVVSGGTTVNGTYTVNTETCNIDADLVASNGIVTIHMPYSMEGDTFTVYNNNNEALTKQA